MAYRKAGRLLLVVLSVYGLLVATHDGEFWPFSVYQMFSSAGRPWTRMLIRDVPSIPPATLRWTPEDMADLSGRPFAMREHGVPQNDVAAYVVQTAQWTPARGEGLRAMLGYETASERVLAVYRIEGSLAQDGAVAVTCTPVLYLTPDTLLVNPHFDADETSKGE